MGLPSITIEFIKKAVQAIRIGSTGIVGIILTDTANVGILVLKDVSEIPDTFSDANKAYIERAFAGAPSKVIVYTFGTTVTYTYSKATPTGDENPKTLGWYELVDNEYVASEDTEVDAEKTYYVRTANTTTTTLSDALTYFKNTKVNFLCAMPDVSTANCTTIATWVKGVWKNTPNRPMVVLPNTAGDHKAIINFAVTGATAGSACIGVGDESFTEAQYCSRIAGLLAGLPYTVSATYKPLTEVTSIPIVEPDTVSEAVDAGKLTLYDNGDNIVIARGVTSLQTVTQEETEDLKKIKIVCIQSLIESDLYTTINNSYIGNYTNSYDNKCLLITAIGAYFKQLDTSEGGAGYINENHSIEIDLASQRTYLESKGIDTSSMNEQEIKEANTDSWVFLAGQVSILDAIEDVKIRINKV